MRTVYLDNAATSQMPEPVLAAMVAFEVGGRANVHRGLYPLAAQASTAYESARAEVAGFISAPVESLVFTKSTTEGLNLVACGIAERLGPGDEVLVTIADHHASVLPWLVLSRERGFSVRTIGLDADFRLDMVEARRLVGPQTKVIALPLVSNVLGAVMPVEDIVKLAREVGSLVIVDGAQAVGHLPVNVAQLGCDAFAFSAHKMYGPMGIGALFLGERLKSITPLLYGGGMLESVSELRLKDGSERFEGGTPNVTGAIGFAAAVRYLNEQNIDRVRIVEHQLTSELLGQLSKITGMQLVGPAGSEARIGIVSFTLNGLHPHDVAQLLGEQGVCVRAGYHCVEPLARSICPRGSIRVSLGFKNTPDDIEEFISVLHIVQDQLAYV